MFNSTVRLSQHTAPSPADLSEQLGFPGGTGTVREACLLPHGNNNHNPNKTHDAYQALAQGTMLTALSTSHITAAKVYQNQAADKVTWAKVTQLRNEVKLGPQVSAGSEAGA